MATTVGMCSECLQGERSSGWCYNLSWVMPYPRGTGSELWVARESQPAYAPRRVWVVTCSQLGSCRGGPRGHLWAHRPQFHWPLTSAAHVSLGSSRSRGVSTSGVKGCSQLIPPCEGEVLQSGNTQLAGPWS